ncbi:MAG: nucleotidyltransferase domain-containing protein [Deltaproteobacteria bacterium]|nr:nucleotidyltransferase domain-containing protein [Deltaproteobacteria bacterium]
MLTGSDQKLILELKRRVQKAAGDRLQSLVAYGSRAWGGAGPDSDLDVAAIIQGLTPELETALQEAAYQVMWDHDFSPLISLKVFDAKNFAAFQEQGFSFYRKVAREGISL